ncbi:unnamed protein product [Prunus brigantina]
MKKKFEKTNSSNWVYILMNLLEFLLQGSGDRWEVAEC